MQLQYSPDFLYHVPCPDLLSICPVFKNIEKNSILTILLISCPLKIYLYRYLMAATLEHISTLICALYFRDKCLLYPITHRLSKINPLLLFWNVPPALRFLMYRKPILIKFCVLKNFGKFFRTFIFVIKNLFNSIC